MKNILAVALIIFSLSGFSQDVGLELGFGIYHISISLYIYINGKVTEQIILTTLN